jgi:hypothetical protein
MLNEKDIKDLELFVCQDFLESYKYAVKHNNDCTKSVIKNFLEKLEELKKLKIDLEEFKND